MNNPSQRQMIVIGIGALFGIPICIGLVVGYFAGFWAGVIATVGAIAVIAYIAQWWWRKQRK